MSAQSDDSEDLLGHSLEEILQQTATPGQALAAGSAAALTVALAAALTGSVARGMAHSTDKFGLATQSEALRLRASDLVERNRVSFAGARAALSGRSEGSGYHDVRIGDAMERSLEVLQTIAGTAADVCELSALLADDADPASKPDAVSAAVLAASGAQVAVRLIEANLISVRHSGKHAEATESLRVAEVACRRATDHAPA